jgi:hypothetical protein
MGLIGWAKRLAMGGMALALGVGAAAADDMVPPTVDSSSFVSSIAQTASYFGIDEVRLGPALTNLELLPQRYVIPDVQSFNKARLDGAEFDVLFKSPDVFKWIGSPRPSIGGIVSLDGYESLIHAGIDYHVPLGSTPFYAEVGGGVGVHTGYLDNAPPGFHNLGCPVLLHWKAGLGVNLTDHVTATLDWQHMSNIVFRCNPNEGLNDIGLVLGWKF